MSGPGNENTHGDRSGMRPPGAPRWLKVSGIVVAAVVVVALIVSLVTGTDHSPGIHESWVVVPLGRKSNGTTGPLQPIRWF